MSREGLKQFRRAVFLEPGLQEQLFEAADAEAFAARTARLAEQAGLEVLADEVREALRAGRQEWQYRWLPPEASWREGWLPVGIEWQGRRAIVDWVRFGRERLEAPFFEDAVRRALRHPFNVLWRHQTPVECPEELPLPAPPLPLAGLIYHVSRCGSTLLSRMLAALPPVAVISEAPPLDSVVRAPGLAEEERIAWMRWMMAALGQPRGGSGRRLVVKLDSWHILDAELFEKAFPGTPSVFVSRDPVEVMVSHARRRGNQMVPGTLPAERLGTDAASVAAMPLDEYCAWVLAAFLRAAVACADAGARPRLDVIDYRELAERPVEIATSVAARHFGLALNEEERGKIEGVARLDAKNPSFFFTADSAAKWSEATETIRALAASLVRPEYEKLAQSSPGSADVPPA